MKAVFVCSPYSADPTRYTLLARELCRLTLVTENASPLAPHLIYPQMLDETSPLQRELGIDAGLAWMDRCDQVWVWTLHGITAGMQREISHAESLGIPIVCDPECWAECQSHAVEDFRGSIMDEYRKQAAIHEWRSYATPPTPKYAPLNKTMRTRLKAVTRGLAEDAVSELEKNSTKFGTRRVVLESDLTRLLDVLRNGR